LSVGSSAENIKYIQSVRRGNILSRWPEFRKIGIYVATQYDLLEFSEAQSPAKEGLKR
jgi:hypothetical protein